MERKTRQQLLILCTASPNPESHVVAWSLYDSSLSKDALQMRTGDSVEPLYRTVLDAMRDGWRVITYPVTPYYDYGHENETGHIPNEFVLERMVEVCE